MNGVFPPGWKAAYIIPLPEPKQHKDLGPISILSILSKILEMRYHFESQKILPSPQSGFRKVVAVHFLMSQIIY